MKINERKQQFEREQQFYENLYIEHFSRGEEISIEELKEKYPYPDEANGPSRKEKEDIFIIKVRSRDNRTFQGDVMWANRNDQRHFRSDLELLRLIGNALDRW